MTRKNIIFDELAKEEITEFPEEVGIDIESILETLSAFGFLREPVGKLLKGTELFEIRVRNKGQLRVLYAYFGKIDVIILHGFQKKTQKTPLQHIKLAQKRLRKYTL